MRRLQRDMSRKRLEICLESFCFGSSPSPPLFVLRLISSWLALTGPFPLTAGIATIEMPQWQFYMTTSSARLNAIPSYSPALLMNTPWPVVPSVTETSSLPSLTLLFVARLPPLRPLSRFDGDVLPPARPCLDCKPPTPFSFCCRPRCRVGLSELSSAPSLLLALPCH